ncbi:hypothetical protein ICY20_02755 [Pseudomonas sp. P115]|uniref:M12 family metallopeptidase n=1 Tax=Pseudomonas pisciculturae TaxID=2730413 RepID=UPI00189284F6|nr:M12 family metallopeptidase [Pseudomonas pisciculturae]MBF6026638.1 hypothetical protein [Pseudomonas pisciculturae]
MISASAITNTIALCVNHSDPAPPQTQTFSRSRRNVGELATYWPQNSTIKIAMYDYKIDDPYELAVKKAASQWLPHINLKFDFVTGEEGDVRIAANPHHGGQSTVGTHSQSVAPWEPTMILPSNHTTATFDSTVLHEFGHMLGAHHAHQHPDANIPWHQPSLDQHFSAARQQVNWLPLPRSDQYELLPYDPDSIMHYSINPELTTENTFHSRNAMLSEDDIAWAKKTYPKAPTE